MAGQELLLTRRRDIKMYGSVPQSDGSVVPEGASSGARINRRTLITSVVFLGLPFLVVTLYLTALSEVRLANLFNACVIKSHEAGSGSDKCTD